MIANSLRFRLLGTAAIVILIALQVAGIALLTLFERNVVRQVDIELDADLEQLIASLDRHADDSLELTRELADPRFRQPLAGRYWQIAAPPATLLRSRSLWDFQLETNAEPEPREGVKRIILQGPASQVLYGALRTILLEGDIEGQPDLRVVVVAAMDTSEIATLKQQFRGDVIGAMGLLALLLIGAAWAQVLVGLRPFEQLRTGVERVRLGQERRLEKGVPHELQPLVSETNRLLEEQEKVLERARARAGDLAHGLKTPLTALTVMSQRLRDQGQGQTADELELQLRHLGAHVERELSLSRIAAGSGIAHRTPLRPVLDRLVRTMRRLPRGDLIEWQISDVPAKHVLAVDEADLTELLGNLLDNARKWARSRVVLCAHARDKDIVIVVEDDGPGIEQADIPLVLRRGLRLDESKPGHGLGLTIVKDVAEAYGGGIDLGPADSGGLRAIVRIPGG